MHLSVHRGHRKSTKFYICALQRSHHQISSRCEPVARGYFVVENGD